MSIREETERRELASLNSNACFSAHSKGREVYEPPCDIRMCFQRDIDRITHSKAFRRLAHKTQVFLKPESDHYRTRLTHTLEVSRIARTMTRGLNLNEDLTEAVALGHDLGHTPFGHAGEDALNELLDGGFTHNEQSYRIVRRFEYGGRKMNLCREVCDGVRNHTGEALPETLEARIVRFADRIAYINHDFDDAARANILREDDLPKWIRDCLGTTPIERIDTLVRDLVMTSLGKPDISLSPERAKAMNQLREFMFERVYYNPVAKPEEEKGRGLLRFLFEYYAGGKDKMPPEYRAIAEIEGVPRAVADYVSSMTDRYAVMVYTELVVPKGWEKI
ncbi:MAG: deoxyguanosinetriphosphate triphosphohydrolase [Oscillospiraceae bacterium]|nr:deoxyguanosinetriphosphate triphosphohydrolase [Oscillospiraceae bacterium]